VNGAKSIGWISFRQRTGLERNLSQLWAMLTFKTDRILLRANGAKSIGWISFRHGNPYQAMQVLKINELQRMGLEAG
jgi:hypothetical protein